MFFITILCSGYHPVSLSFQIYSLLFALLSCNSAFLHVVLELWLDATTIIRNNNILYTFAVKEKSVEVNCCLKVLVCLNVVGAYEMKVNCDKGKRLARQTNRQEFGVM